MKTTAGIKYDEAAKAMYIKLSNKSFHHTVEKEHCCNIDYAEDNTIIGIELLCITWKRIVAWNG
jgi:uncharacterized protein YuzE